MAKIINVGTLISGGGTNLQAIIDSTNSSISGSISGSASDQIDAKILFTGSDTPGVKGLARAQKANIDTFVVDYAKIIRACKQGIDDADLPSDFNLGEILEKQQLVTPDVSSVTSPDRIEFFLKSRAIAEDRKSVV